MSETEKCPTCGTAVRLVYDDHGTSTNHYEPLGLDALERSVVEAAIEERRRYKVWVDGVPGGEEDEERHRKWAQGIFLLQKKSDALLTARAAHVGKEAGGGE